ncbi:hypothetical protein GCM10023185_21930 [Hymenobacter saemangeumensis]|uniref:Uncharacterized protein n=1 Tax=Hymenobacter saemangeumensis TaxID=1084522 RepID=A0ABP8IEN1_9BACT
MASLASTLGRQWLLSLLLGSALYAAYHGVVHFSDWCYLGVSTAVAGGISLLMVPLNGLLLHRLSRHGTQWPAAGRWAGLLGGTATIFALANVPVLPLHTMLGPGSTLPWGIAALSVAAAMRWRLMQNPEQPTAPGPPFP